MTVTRYHDPVQYQKKTNDPILRKLSDGRTEGRTDRQTDESDFIGQCPTNVERPISKLSQKLHRHTKINSCTYPLKTHYKIEIKK